MSRAMWTRYQVPAMIVGLVAAVAVIVIVVAGISGVFSSTRLLTVTKPTGGSILGPYISCGSIGSTCTGARTSTEIVQLTAQPDDGFAFVGWTGDCVPNGRVMMNAARTCSATFERMLEPPPPITHVLTILPPQGGTIVGLGINCGTQGSQCSTSVPNGDEVKLDVLADKGFEFKGYTGACAPNGATIMSEPRECSALFAQHVGNLPSPSSSPSGPVSVHRAPPPPSVARDNSPNPGATGDQPDSKGSTRDPGTPSSTQSGAPTGTPSGVPPGTPSGTATAQSVAEQNAKANIPKTLEEYRKAHERLDLKEVQRVYPHAPQALKEQFRTLRSMVYELQKEQEFIALDLPAGTATVKVSYKMTFRVPAGNAPPPEEGYVIFKLRRTDQNSDTWLIDLAEYHPKSVG